jgi:hypothetical protein
MYEPDLSSISVSWKMMANAGMLLGFSHALSRMHACITFFHSLFFQNFSCQHMSQKELALCAWIAYAKALCAWILGIVPKDCAY